MIQKTERCLYCGEKMDSVTAKKKFCCDLHRVYWNREKKKPQKGSSEYYITVGKEFDETVKQVVEKTKKKHPLYKEGDPPEKSNAFFLRYGAFTYDEIQTI